MTYNEEILKDLSEEERNEVLKILGELSKDGKSDTYNKLLYEDYNEIPVDIETFLSNDNYLGKAWKDAKGKLKIYPFWLEQLKKLFPDNVSTAYQTLLESGARGIGKSEIACGAVCPYLMYRIMCLKNPMEFYHLKLTEKIVFAFMNIKLDLAKEIAVSKFQKTIQMSPWFMSKGSMSQKENQPYWTPPEPLSIVIGSQSDDVIGKPVYFAFFDEISFIRNQDIDKQKQKAKDMIDTALGGMTTRFIHNGKNPTLLVVASSKRSEQSFMESYIKQLSENEEDTTLVIDKPVWEVKPKGTYKDQYFYIGLGNKFLANIVLPDNADLDTYKEKGYSIVKAPIDFKAKALEDLERMLCDYAGISSFTANKYLSAGNITECIDNNFSNPLPDIIETGNAKDDKVEYYNLFNMNNIPKNLMSKPLFIHLDMSISGDMTGIAGVWISGKKVSTDENNQAKDLSFQLAFSTSIKAPKGHQISFAKNRNFIRWLRDTGFVVKKITYDTFQSYDTGQQLKSENFDCEVLSVDRVDSDHICKPYQYFKSTIDERRFKMYKSNRLFDEMIDIERNINTGKVDHTPNFHKDVLDAVVGATFTASKYADQYAYDFGEDLKQAIDVSASTSVENYRKQVNIDFEKQLQQMFNPVNLMENPSENNGDLTKISANNNLHNADEITQEQLEKAAPMQINPPSFVVQPKANQPIVIGRDILLW